MINNNLIDPELEPLCATCYSCNKEVAINKITQEDGSRTYYLSCGHNSIIKVINEFENIEERHNYFIRTLKRKLRKMFRNKISGKTKRRTKELLEFDKERRIKIHKVEELNDFGEWELVHNEEVPFKDG
jgi:hypothetical protein